ncbi:hypothetical protein AB9Q10_20090 [Streptomyces krungchingensis]|uniref:hypothetical protein n=1 Tax=Streptomyces krungchingensis TaxID=1565034 RepID=UPI003CEB1C89
MSQIAPPRPVERTPVAGDCSGCGRAELAAYDVVGETGWTHVVKCRHCLTSVRRTPANRLGPINLLVDQL